MATKISLSKQLKRQRDAEDGNSGGTYFAIIAMAVLMTMVGAYFWINNGQQLMASPQLQQEEHLTPHDGGL